MLFILFRLRGASHIFGVFGGFGRTRTRIWVVFGHGFGVSARSKMPNAESLECAVDCSAKFRCLKRCSGRTRVETDMVLAFDTIFSPNIVLTANIISRQQDFHFKIV
jgi:hypothetical protein